MFEILSKQSVLFPFLLIGIDMAFGHVEIRGINLGAAAVLFFTIALTAWIQSHDVELRVAPQLSTLSLVLFTFTIGINSGASFFHDLKTAVGPILSMVVLYSITATIGLYLDKAMSMDVPLIAGTFTGSVTNTPVPAAADEASGDSACVTIGYSITYLLGIVDMLVASMAALHYGRNDEDVPSPLSSRTIRVERDNHSFVGDIYEKFGEKISFSCLRRGETGPITRPQISDTLGPGNLVTVIGPRELTARAAAELGRMSSHSFIQGRSYLDFRRMMISNPKVAGCMVASPGFAKEFSATISHVRRGGIDMAAEPGLVLQQDDRVRAIVPTSEMAEITKSFGDSSHGLTDLNPIALGIGMALGIVIDELPIPTPSSKYFSIGSTAETLIMGLIFGRVGRIGPTATALPSTTYQVMAELGLLIFLTQAGAKAGGQILEAFTSGDWIHIFALGFIMTSTMAVGLYCTMRWVFKMGGTKLAGLLGGAQTQPAIPAFANDRTSTDSCVTLDYMLVYPVAMVGKIVVVQILGGMQQQFLPWAHTRDTVGPAFSGRPHSYALSSSPEHVTSTTAPPLSKTL